MIEQALDEGERLAFVERGHAMWCLPACAMPRRFAAYCGIVCGFPEAVNLSR